MANEDYETWKRGVIKYCGEECTENLIKNLGNKIKIREATFSSTADSGMAGKGQFLKQALNLVRYAISINRMLPQESQVNEENIARVALLSHVSKVDMFDEIPNPRNNTLYTFNHEGRKSALRTGEKSVFLCLCSGINFTEEEYEAMRIIDLKDDDNMAKLYSSKLALIIKMANNMLELSNNKRLNK